jgi:hypothetical protein
MSRTTYRRADYDRIRSEGFTFVLPADTIATIKRIATNVGAPEYIRTPYFEKQQRSTKLRLPAIEINDTDWDTLRMFKATQIEKKKGVELSIDKIRKHLNKLTSKTYDNLKTQITDEIDTIIQATQGNDELASELNKIGDVVFEIASGNSFYSSMYATLFNMLMSKYEFMKTILVDKLTTIHCLFKDFEYCDPNKDYDKFCKNNKTNEKRRALAQFYVNLMLQNIIPVEKIADVLGELQTDLVGYIKKENNANIVEEISELIYIFINHGMVKLKTLPDEWNIIIERINRICIMKAKSEPSISNKTIFKHMDIQTLIKTNNT